MSLLLLFGELALLFFLSRALTHNLFNLAYRLTRSRTLAITIILLLTFPGTVVHELAHLFAAGVLGVASGKLTLVPENIRGNQWRAGSVMIAKTDPFRRYAIGLAPIIVGIIILSAVSAFFPQLINSVIHTDSSLITNPHAYLLALAGYGVFAVSNSMFSSKEDLAGIVPFLIALTLFTGIFYYLGLRIGLTGEAFAIIERILALLVQSLGVVLAVNVALFGIVQLLFLLPRPP